MLLLRVRGFGLCVVDLTPWLWAFTAVYMDHCAASLNAALENRKAW